LTNITPLYQRKLELNYAALQKRYEKTGDMYRTLLKYEMDTNSLEEQFKRDAKVTGMSKLSTEIRELAEELSK